MAEQLRYEQQLQRLNLPNVDFAAEKEIARGYGAISNKLDQMSNFFMRQAEGMAKAILRHGTNIFFTSDTYKPGTDLVDGSYSLLVQHYVIKHGGNIVDGIDTPVQIIVRVHETDKISADNQTVIFDPGRSYPKADNVIHYGHN